MKRTTISLPDDVAVLLEREARRDTSISEVTRQAVTAYLGLTTGQPRRLPFVDLGSSGQRHTARDMEEILANEWSRPRDR